MSIAQDDASHVASTAMRAAGLDMSDEGGENKHSARITHGRQEGGSSSPCDGACNHEHHAWARRQNDGDRSQDECREPLCINCGVEWMESSSESVPHLPTTPS